VTIDTYKLSQQTGKPVVNYIKGSNDKIVVGSPVILWPLNHTSEFVSNEAFARTSVVKVVYGDTEDGVSAIFETQNSIYVPVTLDY
jgi:hypothetical protein